MSMDYCVPLSPMAGHTSTASGNGFFAALGQMCIDGEGDTHVPF